MFWCPLKCMLSLFLEKHFSYILAISGNTDRTKNISDHFKNIISLHVMKIGLRPH